MRAVRDTGVKTVVLAGGVSANSMLRRKMADQRGIILHIPRPVYCTDNGAMIAITGAMKLEAGMRDGLELQAFAS